MPRKLVPFGIIAIVLFVFSATASALQFDLIYEFDGALPVQSYGTVDVTESLSNLNFTIVANSSILGANADIHELYFNLITEFTGLSIFNDNAPNNSYTVIGPNLSVAGGAGASFDWGVNFGNGGGSNGNETLQFASFTLSADQEFSVDDLLEFSNPNNTPPVNIAVHFQETNTQPGSETVGGVPVPVPATMLLLGSGLFCFAVFRNKFKKTYTPKQL